MDATIQPRVAMPIRQRLLIALRSLLALVVAIGAVQLVNIAGGWLSDALGIAPSSHARHVLDLLWAFLAGVAGAWCFVRIAATAKRAHAWFLLVLYLALDIQIVVQMRGIWPLWFGLGVVLTVPLQVWLGWRLATNKQQRAAHRMDLP